mmetsp:Transcript_23578/g.29714  ORF Transcript_23578/g.29714 Transcript_23578/m.29714 type:complete len:92 (+) Transcript_23578:126-401(+)
MSDFQTNHTALVDVCRSNGYDLVGCAGFCSSFCVTTNLPQHHYGIFRGMYSLETQPYQLSGSGVLIGKWPRSSSPPSFASSATLCLYHYRE